jgi:glycosyltransferase involved in cell wall biosynthesis
MAACDVFCLASHYEGLPIALMEALVLGLPVVATDVGGIREIVTDGEQGVLVPRAAPTQLADALLRMAADGAARRRYAKAAAATGAELDISHAIRRTEAIYAATAATGAPVG